MTEPDRLSKIETVLGRVDERVENLCARLSAREAEQDSLHNAVYGHNGTPGLLTEIALLKAAQGRATWVTRAVIGAVLPLIATAVWAVLSK